MDFDFEFDELIDELKGYIEKVDDPTDILSIGAKSFVQDLLKLPKPMSKVRKAGYTHLLNTINYRKSPYANHKNDIEVGWGKTYGGVIEHGTYKMREQPHMIPTFNKNKNKYYKQMISYFHRGR